jgi:hypothetical protein
MFFVKPKAQDYMLRYRDVAIVFGAVVCTRPYRYERWAN